MNGPFSHENRAKTLSEGQKGESVFLAFSLWWGSFFKFKFLPEGIAQPLAVSLQGLQVEPPWGAVLPAPQWEAFQ